MFRWTILSSPCTLEGGENPYSAPPEIYPEDLLLSVVFDFVFAEENIPSNTLIIIYAATFQQLPYMIWCLVSLRVPDWQKPFIWSHSEKDESLTS